MLASFWSLLELPFTTLALLFYRSFFLLVLLLTFLYDFWLVELRLLIRPLVGTTVHSSLVSSGGMLVNFSRGRLNLGTLNVSFLSLASFS